jgi:branched-chain amino acid transport system ATP-binding protein
MAASACWKSRSRSRRARKCCCSTNPRQVFEAVAGLSDQLTLLFIEHDMHVVFRFASHIIVLVSGAIFAEGSPKEIAADPGVREVYLGTRKHG